MQQEILASWPVIPLIVVGALGVIAAAGLIVMLYDSGARDSGRMTQIGIVLLGIGVSGCLSIGVWNMAVGAARLAAHQNMYTVSAPIGE